MTDEKTKEDSPTMKEETTTTNSATAYEHARDPFFAFIPQIFLYITRILGSELGHVQRGVVGFPSGSRAYLGETFSFYRQNPKTLYDEVISGFTVAIMQVPESIAFSFVAGVPPLSGLHATFWMATVTGLMGGKPGMISGAAGALAVVVADMTRDGGALDYLPMAERLNVLYMTMFACGIAQILFALFRLAKLVRLIPETGMLGFMNGLAIIIFLAQLPAFQKCDGEEFFVDCTVEERQWLTFANDTWPLILSLIHVAICMAIMKFFPKVPVIGRIIPASLVGLLVGTLLEHTLFRMAFGVETRTVKDTAEMSGTLPQFSWPSVPRDGETIRVIISYAITLAAIGSVESVLTLQACNEITDTVPKISDSNQEMFAQGLANLICGLFRAMGGDAMIGQSTINIMNGARYRVSSTMSGIFMLLFVVAISGFIKLLPVSTLTGVLFMVVLSTFQWRTFMILRYGRLSDSFAIVLVTGIAVYLNLAVAIAVGIIFSALVHAWDSGAHVDADIEHKKMIVNGEETDVKYVHLKGAVFFSSSRKFVNMFSVADDPKTVVIDFKDGLIIDHSAVAAIQGITHRFAQVDKRVLLINLPVKSEGRLHRTGDHDMLKDQITQSEHVKDAKDIEGGENTGEESGDSLGSNPEAASDTPPEHVDSGTVGEVYKNLNQFDTGIEPVENEIEKLAKEQGELSIHSKKDS